MSNAAPAREETVSALPAARWLTKLALGQDRGRAVLAFLPLRAVCLGAIAVGLRLVIDRFQHHDAHGVLVAAALAGGALLLLFAGGYWQASTALLRLREQADIAIDEQILALTSGVPTLQHFDDPGYLDRLEILRIGRFPLTQVVSLLRDTFFLVTSLLTTTALLVSVDPRLGVLPVFMVPVVWVYYRSQGIINATERSVAEHRRRALHLFDIGTGFAEAKELRVLGEERTLQRLYARTWAQVDHDLAHAETRALARRSAAWLLYAGAVSGGLFVAINNPSGGHLSAGALFLAATVAIQLGSQATWAALTATQLSGTLDLARHFVWLSQRATRLRDDAYPLSPKPVPERLHNGITVHHVTFRYPSSSTPALDDVSLELDAGTTVAVVGENGAGKTTLVKLLCGLYTPDTGEIAIDGVPLTSIDPEAWFKPVTVVCQDYAQFEFIARHTVGVGDLPALDDDATVRTAIEHADAASIIRELPQGLETQLGPRFQGSDLSGGQWQRLALARGLMPQRPLLVALDEPTGAVDATTEQSLLERFVTQAHELAHQTGAIIIFVSHRYSTVRSADHIVVLDQGRLIEQGTHDGLIEMNGAYAELYQRQAAAYR